jgi:hypothetical protein
MVFVRTNRFSCLVEFAVMKRIACLFLLCSLGLVLAGCGGGSDPRATVKGKVSLDGKPVPAGKVVFQSEAGDKTAFADIVDGAYSSNNVPVGKVKYAVQPVQKSAKSNMPKGAKMPGDVGPDFGKGEDQSKYVDIPMHLRDPSSSSLSTTIEATGETVLDIPLKSKVK